MLRKRDTLLFELSIHIILQLKSLGFRMVHPPVTTLARIGIGSIYLLTTYKTWIQVNKIELKTGGNLTVVWSRIHCYKTKRPIKVDVMVARSTENIQKMLKHPQPTLDDEM